METTRTATRFATTLIVALSAVAVVGGGGFASLAHAATVQTIQFATDGGSEPVWGQGITINVDSIPVDALIPPTVALDFVGLRMGDPTVGSAGRTAVYMHVYDGFGITAGGAVDDTAIGTLIAVSTNTLDLEAAAPSTDLIWNFAGPILAKDATYHYILANDTVAASVGSFSNLIYSDLVVAINNPHAGGQNYRQTGDLGDGPTSHDVFFRVQSSIVPEPSTCVLGILGLLSLSFSARRRLSRA